MALAAQEVLDEPDDDGLLSPEETALLARRMEAGALARECRTSGRRFADATDDELALLEADGEQARQRFIRGNLRLVGMVARQFSVRSHLADADLFQEGCLGLITAVERFDHARGHRFSTYALFWIRAYVGAATARHLGAINLPTSRAEQLRAARGVESELTQRLGRVPTVAEVADALGRTASWTADLLAHQRPHSLDLVDGSILDTLHAVDELEPLLSRDLTVSDLLRRLPDLERTVLELRLGFASTEPLSYARTARALQISVTRVRRVETRALERLRTICPQQASAHL